MDINILNKDILEKFGVKASYILFECLTCKRKWGKNITENTLAPEELVCQQCSVKKTAAETL